MKRKLVWCLFGLLAILCLTPLGALANGGEAVGPTVLNVEHVTENELLNEITALIGVGPSSVSTLNITCIDGAPLSENDWFVLQSIPSFPVCLTEINFIDANITYVPANAFVNMANLVTVTGLDHATSVDFSAFGGCTSLTGVKLADGAAVGDAAFIDCLSLTSVGSGAITSVGTSAFEGCMELTGVVLAEGATVEKDAFKNCRKLKSVGTNQIYIDAGCFEGCQLLEAVKLANCAKAFAGCRSLKTVAIGDDATIPAGLFGDSPVESLTVGKNAGLGDRAFKGFTSLKTLELGTGATLGAGAFEDCLGLNIATLGNGAVLGNSAFSGCSRLTSVTGAISSMGAGAFEGCTSLLSVTVGNGAVLGNSAFYGCAKLEAVSGKPGKVGSNAFNYCTSLSSISIVDGAEIQASAFMYCTVLETVSGKLGTVGHSAFDGCAKLRSLDWPVSGSYGTNAFRGCALDFTKGAPGGLDLLNASGQKPYALFAVTNQGVLTISEGDKFELEKAYSLTTANGTPYRMLTNPPYAWLDVSFIGANDHSPTVTLSGSYDASKPGSYPLILKIPDTVYANAHELSFTLKVNPAEPSPSPSPVPPPSRPEWWIPGTFRATKGFRYDLVEVLAGDPETLYLNITSNKKNIIAISANGQIVPKSAGKATITVRDSLGVKMQCAVTVYGNSFSRGKPSKGSGTGVITSTKRLYYSGNKLNVEVFILNKSGKSLKKVTGLRLELWDEEKGLLLYTKPVGTLPKTALKNGKYKVYSTSISDSQLPGVRTKRFDLGHAGIQARLVGF